MTSVTVPIVVPDAEQRKQAIDPYRSFIVEAPAGSGKTSLLVQRFLRLLGQVERPESVVAMTFTRKAAAEMRERVVAAMAAARSQVPLEGEYEAQTRKLAEGALRQSGAKGWHILTNSGRLQIQTIDAFCYMLVRQMPLTSGFGGLADVVDDATALYRAAARRTLSQLAETDGALFRRLALHFDNNLERLAGLIVPMLAKRDQWRIRAGDLDDELINDFCTLQHRSQEALLQVFREEAKVDFSEVTNAALRALGSPEQPTDLLYWLDYRIQHLLVDEFQDTSRRQYDLLEALSGQWSEVDGRTLFVVGDPMQSIYRFREADVSLFLRCWSEQRLGSVRLKPLRLVSNFRSATEIVEWTQTTFAPIMREDDQAYGGVKLRPASAVRGPSGVVPNLIPLLNDNGSREAQTIVDLIRRAPVRSDVAVLVRSRSQVTTLLPMLREAGIDYEAIDIDNLGEEQHILDLLSLTRAVLHVGDRLSWLACLRAPWCGLTVQDLAGLAEGEPKRTILELLSDPDKIAALTPEGRIRAAKVQEVLSAAVEQVGRMPLRDLVEKTWMALDGPAVLQGKNQSDDVDTFLNLLEECEQGGVIRDFGTVNARLECLWAKPAKAADAVQILTVHNAKGLEFGTVIIPKLGARTTFSERDPVIWTEHVDEDGSLNLLVAGKPQSGVESENYKLIGKELDKKEEYELQRLFYVATTRAKNELYLLGNVKLKKNGELPSVDKRTFLGLIWDDARAVFESELRTHPLAPQGEQTENEAPAKETILRRLPAGRRAPLLEMSVARREAYQRVTASSGKPSYHWVSNTGRHVGTIVHGLLKRIAAEGVDGWTEERLGAMEPMIRGELMRLGVSGADQAGALLQVMRSLGNTLGSERGRWILQRHREARSEWGLEGLIGEQLVSGTVDRTFRDAEGRLWIIDFKTSQHEGAGLQSFLKREEARYRPQLQNYATLISRMQAGPICLGLYFPLLDAWREWEFAEERAARPGPYTGK